MINGVYRIAKISSLVEMFGFSGLGVNFHSWPREDFGFSFDSQTVLGINLGLGGKIRINQKIDLNLRIGYYKSMTSNITINGVEYLDDYNHAMVPVMLGISYRLGI